jgi:hypothetical protein
LKVFESGAEERVWNGKDEEDCIIKSFIVCEIPDNEVRTCRTDDF